MLYIDPYLITKFIWSKTIFQPWVFSKIPSGWSFIDHGIQKMVFDMVVHPVDHFG